MRAVVARGYGPPEHYTVAEIPEPEAGPGQLKVRVAAASINPAEVRVVAERMVDLDFPHVPGNDFAGTVVAIGPGVTGYAVGDEVFGMALPRALRAMAGPRPSLGTGALAEYVVVEADTPFIAHRPAGLDVVHAAAIPTVGFTARALQHRARVTAGEKVLVIGATGGTGTAVVPYLAATGAHIIATATETDEALLRRLGAAETVDYRASAPVAETLRRHPEGVDVVVNLVVQSEDLSGLAAAARPGGRVYTITFPPPVPGSAGRDDVTLELILDLAGEAGGMAEVGEAALAGTLPAVIGREFALEEGPAAVVAFAREHTTGKIVVSM
ncbi:NADPH:quinone oxidoreductase [Actinorhabdospora filicis]|uniref:NADPH:quinone oxidoreductase n=1 Tax=Actinorhabdospora filicis TaxID=1785913 RepID=A0A9W6W2C1_9ACTN|nr:NADP-dependent oxidoreductase [Actinorhabdospora filicis]GLZ76852.1 NADPH:quinone oxidoreductase [Actinorhabdospora filicis]